MRQQRIRRIRDFFKNPWVRLAAYLVALFTIVRVLMVLNDTDDIGEALLSIVNDNSAVSVFAIGIFTLICSSIVRYVNRKLEESEKTEADHRKIVAQYSAHHKGDIFGFTPLGNFLEIYSQNLDTEKKYNNPYRNKYSESHVRWDRDMEYSGFNGDASKACLTLSSVSVFANDPKKPIKGICISDKDVKYTIPHYVHLNAQYLMAAHATTAMKSNETTIRLSDVSYYGHEGVLSFETERSTYYEMLMTNRCMDYQHHPNITLRQLYEYKDHISALSESVFGNQIGINGLVITSDGYLLLEKRDLSKSTWKDKFSQPISLAMKKKDIPAKYLDNGRMKPEHAEDIFGSIIEKTLGKNYGIKLGRDYDFSLSECFMGLARDMLEGGKPNLYFNVTLKIDADTLRRRMEYDASIKHDEGEHKRITDDKLRSDFYLVHKSRVRIDYYYMLSLRMKDRHKENGWMHIKRIQSPRSGKLKVLGSRLKRKLFRATHREYSKECGEALLVCIAYMQQLENDL